MEETGKCLDKAKIDRANLVALDREVKSALDMADGNGLVPGVEILRATSAVSTLQHNAAMSVLKRYLTRRGYAVRLVSNVTDITFSRAMFSSKVNVGDHVRPWSNV